MQNLTTEEDVRTKFVYDWLRKNGIQPSDIDLEHRVVFQIGHGQFESENKEGRFDLLVKSSSGKNLILFEVKAPNIEINEAAIDQAVSYARVLKGNMAPIVVVTNSKVFDIYCSLTKNKINNINIEQTNFGDFYCSGSDMNIARAEALSILSQDDYFIRCLCKHLSDTELSRLSGDITDFKKYCSDLYIPLEEKPESDLDMVLVKGPPQSGKTNYICNAFYEFSEAGRKSLFFRAKSIKKGIISYLKEHVTGYLDAAANTSEKVTNNIISRGDVTIFIDGLNEVSRNERDDIICDIERIAALNVSFVISCTDSFVHTIKVDSYNNPSDIFKSKKDRKVKELEIPPLNSEIYRDVISHYQKVYKTKEKPKQRLNSVNAVGKFYQLISSGYSAQDLDSEYKVLINILEEKCKSILEIEQLNAKGALLYLAQDQAENSSGLNESLFCEMLTGKKFGILPDAFKTIGILEIQHGFVEFYDETYRDILLIEHCIENSNQDDVIQRLSSFPNLSISYTCLFKYLCFHRPPTSKIFELELDIQIKMIETITSYIRSCELANSHIVGLLLDLLMSGIKNDLITPERAESVLIFIADICNKQGEISVDYVKTQYILGYCSNTIVLPCTYEFEEHPSGFYNGEYLSDSIYNYLGWLFNKYLIEGYEVIFTSNYINEIKLAKELHGEKIIRFLEQFYGHLIDHIFNYDSGYCSYGSYLSVEIEHFRESGSSEGLKEAFEMLIELKSLLSNTPVFDGLIDEINGEFSFNDYLGRKLD